MTAAAIPATCSAPAAASKVYCAELQEELGRNLRSGLVLCPTRFGGQLISVNGPFYRYRPGIAGKVVNFCPFCGGSLIRPAPDPDAPPPPKPHIERRLS